MLRNIDPLLSPELLYTLRAMGHGDEIAIVDANYPAENAGPTCLRLDGISASGVLRAVLSVMPLDTYVPSPAHVMQVVGSPDEIPEAVAEFQQIIDSVADAPAPLASLERFAFYDRAAQGFAVIQTGERKLYGNIVLTKGIISP